MKKLVLVTLLAVLSIAGYSQTGSLSGKYGLTVDEKRNTTVLAQASIGIGSGNFYDYFSRQTDFYHQNGTAYVHEVTFNINRYIDPATIIRVRFDMSTGKIGYYDAYASVSIIDVGTNHITFQGTAGAIRSMLDIGIPFGTVEMKNR